LYFYKKIKPVCQSLRGYFFSKLFCAILLLCSSIFAHAQPKTRPVFNYPTKNAFLAGDVFIENVGQYGNKYNGYEVMDSILFGFEGHSMPILFTKRGIIFLQRKVERISKEAEEKLEKQGVSEEEIEHKKIVTERTITMEWLGANVNIEIIEENKTNAYHIYGLLPQKAYGYKKITFKNLYDGINLVYSYVPNSKIGFEYSFEIAAGADISQIKMEYGGDVKTIKLDKAGNLIIKSDIDGIQQTIPIMYYSKQQKTTNTIPNKPTTKNEFQTPQQQIANNLLTNYTISNGQVSFTIKENYDNTQPIIIDPFVSSTSNLDGLNAGKAKDIDYDYAGNIYVTGGGDVFTNHRLAKYNAAGVLQWTFNGILTIPNWKFGIGFGGWVVEKTSGNIYLGQGLDVNGFRVVRLNSNGLYDNFITTADVNFKENWKMIWSCNNGSPQVFIAGGSTNSNINLGVLIPATSTINSLNLTGINTFAQDIIDFVIDPINNDLFSIYNSLLFTPSINNKIYKNLTPYSNTSVAWNLPSGYNSFEETKNRPYLIGSDVNDNSANVFALNQNYLFYWDGKNLKAFNKATGVGVGVPFITTNIAKMTGGIYADACNNIYIGDINGTIKVYNFNGSTFDDAPADLTITGYATKSVYDLAFNETDKLLYASGDGFLASFDLSNICNSNTTFNLNIAPDCFNASATTTLTPAPSAGSTVIFALYIGNTFVTSNSTGVFISLLPLTNYKIIATINAACSGTQVAATFTLPAPNIATTTTSEICGNAAGQIVATATGAVSPYSYSINGTNFFPSGTFTGLSANTYTITVKDVNGCTNTKQVVVANNSFTPTFQTSYVNTNCGNSTGTINATANGGVAPYQYSIDNGANYQPSNIFTGLSAGQYQLKIKDVNGCLSVMVLVDIAPSIAVSVSALPTNATCGFANGIITATSINGVGPFEYSINGGTTYQTSNIFTGLSPSTYTIKIKDGNSCTNNSQPTTISNVAGATVSGVSTNSTCGFANGKITATPVGGTAPFQYSIDNGITYQPSNIFTGLLAGPYTIKIKDANNCLNNSQVINVANTVGASVSGVSTNSTCGFANGKINAIPVGGTLPFQYSIDGGVTYQSSNIFIGLTASSYTITIKDGNNCINTSQPIIVSNTAGATVSGVSTNSTCGFANGKITATAFGGTAPFQYSIDSGITYQASDIFTGLLAATYTITIKDANNCLNNSQTISVANTAGATVTGVATNSTCGFANGILTVTPFGGTAPYQYSIDNGVTYQPSNIFNGLTANTYIITIKDANNCLNQSIQIALTNIVGATVSGVSTNSTCGFANGVITVTGNVGTLPYQFSIDGGVTYQSSNIFNNLVAASYTVTIRDANNCLNSTLPIKVVNTAGATVTATSNNATCGFTNGKITATALGGTPTYQYSIDGGLTYQNSNIFTNLPPTNYTVYIKDANSCINTTALTVGNTPIPILSVFAGRDTSVVIFQPLQLNAIDINNTGFVSYTWSPSLGLNRPDIKNPVAILDKDFAYEVMATTADGCISTDSIKIKITYISDIFVPTAFTPNGDGKNDVLRPKLIGIKELKYFALYNRYGELIHKSANENQGWDGFIKGKAQNTGTFVWTAEVVDYLGRTIFRKGTSMLIR
jgi:gliding motility-associated-like protein